MLLYSTYQLQLVNTFQRIGYASQVYIGLHQYMRVRHLQSIFSFVCVWMAYHATCHARDSCVQEHAYIDCSLNSAECRNKIHAWHGSATKLTGILFTCWLAAICTANLIYETETRASCGCRRDLGRWWCRRSAGDGNQNAAADESLKTTSDWVSSRWWRTRAWSRRSRRRCQAEGMLPPALSRRSRRSAAASCNHWLCLSSTQTIRRRRCWHQLKRHCRSWFISVIGYCQLQRNHKHSLLYSQCWNWPKRTGGQVSRCLKFCPGIEI